MEHMHANSGTSILGTRANGGSKASSSGASSIKWTIKSRAVPGLDVYKLVKSGVGLPQLGVDRKFQPFSRLSSQGVNPRGGTKAKLASSVDSLAKDANSSNE